MAQTISATDSELPKPINAVFQQTFLRRAQQNCPYYLGSMPGVLNKQMGTSTIKWRRIEQEAPTTTALSELTATASYMQGRDADTPSVTDVTATVAKYGQFYIVNEEVDLYNPNRTTDELVAVLGESAGRSLNQLQRNTMEDSSTQHYAVNVASAAAVNAAVTSGDLNYAINVLDRNATRPFYPMLNGSTNIGSAPILPSFLGICHPDVAHDVVGLTGFQGVQSYAGQTALLPGEFGYYGRAGVGVRFIRSHDASIDTDAGATTGTDMRGTSTDTDVYTIMLYGQDAFGSVGLGEKHTDGAYRAGDNTGGWELIHKERGSGGTSDPFDEISTIAWKAFHAAAVLNANFSRALRVGATNLSN